MAVPTIDAALVTQFSTQVHVAAQQMKARLRDKVQIKQMSGDLFAYDGLGAIEAIEQTGRHQPVVFSDIVHTRRKIARRRFTLTLPIDASDVRGALINPGSEYPAACARAMERVFDRIVVEAMFAAVLTGRDFGTSVTFANDDGDTINATAGLTYEKLLEANRLFLDDDVGTDMPEKMYLGLSGDEHEDLMLETELVSGDFSRQYAVDKGRLVSAAGYELVPFAAAATNPILAVASSVRDCFMMSPRAMCVGMSKDVSVKIQERPDLHETTQVELVFELGAVRTEGKLIKKVQTTD
jgi:hypothetical protein